jgi:beta-N-acetylhexosaminidase
MLAPTPRALRKVRSVNMAGKAITSLALAAPAASAALLLGAGSDEAAEPRAGAPAARASAVSALTPRQLAGQRIVCGFDGKSAPQSLLRVIAAGELAGVILFEDNVGGRGRLSSMTAAIQATERPEGLRQPVLISVDQEGGLVKRVPGPPKASAAEMGARGAGYAREQGSATGASLKQVGINVDLAPVLDVGRRGGFIVRQRRSFGSRPAAVSSAGVAFAAGLQEAGVAATAKHFPGLGATANNTDLRPATIRLSRGKLRRVDEAPYAAFRDAGGKLVMVSSARYPALGGGKLPASQSRAVIGGELRGRLGYSGVTISDSLEAPGARAGASAAKVATRAARAGTELLLYVHCDAGMRAARALRRGLASGRLNRSAFEASVERVLALRASL